MQSKVLIINASVRGEQGNSYAIALKAKAYLEAQHHAVAEIYTLTQPKKTVREVYDLLNAFDAFMVVSGTYWNNMSSVLQRFVEVCTPFENTAAFFGKPVAVVISMDSVGGMEVANKIISVFSGFGCWMPPCSVVVISRLGEEAVNRTQAQENDPNEDVWRLEDMEILVDNLIVAGRIEKKQWKTWSYIQLNMENENWPEAGELGTDNPKFI